MTKIKFSFSELLNQPVKLIAVMYPYFLVVLIGIGFIYIGNSGALVQNKIAPALDDSAAVVLDIPISDAKIAAAVNLKDISEINPALIEKGKQLFQTTCSTCHGAEGKGDGVAGAALNPKPRNFHLAEGWKNGRKVTEIYNTLQVGILASGMPGFDYLAPADRIAIIQFIRTWMPSPPKDLPEDIAALDKKFALSAGTKIPGTISIVSAEQVVKNSYAEKNAKIAIVLKKLSAERKTNVKAQLFFSVTNNQQKALTTLYNSQTWQLGEKEFLALLSDNLSTNGFSGRIFSLNSSEISNLFTLLKSIAV